MPDHQLTLLLTPLRCNRAAVLVGALCFFGGILFAQTKTPPAKSKVYCSTESTALNADRSANPLVVRRMVDNLVIAATGKPDRASAWASLVKPKDYVGIKVAASGRAVSGTHPEVVNAIAAGLIEAGVPASNIIVWDRSREDLLAAGFKAGGPLYQLRWIDPTDGYDRKSLLTAPVIGKLIWGDSGFGDKTGMRMEDVLTTGEQLSNKSYFAKVLSKEVTKVINVPSLSDSSHTGCNGALANMTLPNLDNWRRFIRPPSYGDPFLAEIYADEMIRKKVVFTILDGLILQYAGGPSPNPGFTVDHLTLFASFDPVAIDATAVTLLNENRHPSKLPSITEMTRWLESASSIGLGKHRAEDIELLRVGGRTSAEPPKNP